jgi:hypothetical protein
MHVCLNSWLRLTYTPVFAPSCKTMCFGVSRRDFRPMLDHRGKAFMKRSYHLDIIIGRLLDPRRPFLHELYSGKKCILASSADHNESIRFARDQPFHMQLPSAEQIKCAIKWPHLTVSIACTSYARKGPYAIGVSAPTIYSLLIGLDQFSLAAPLHVTWGKMARKMAGVSGQSRQNISKNQSIGGSCIYDLLTLLKLLIGCEHVEHYASHIHKLNLILAHNPNHRTLSRGFRVN